ncbi:Uncharacterised protein [Legionella busanensis]|uniref:Uncharacterized protein n=1 Tax=Legionella busanensis TaxID=190655 RepID=A0A378KE14_9GAMM|nr:Uncharacterised protein [Legionella busanensis]STX81462.1 Uncharacterised protein [Legionella busanensis]
MQTTSEVTLIWIKHIIAKLTAWINAVGHDGLNEVSKRSLGAGLQGRNPGFTLFHPGYISNSNLYIAN